jgi:predicted RNase H-like HicB family nuclease
MIELDFKYSYFNGETLESFEFANTIELQAKTMEDAREEAQVLMEMVKHLSNKEGAMMDTFYFEYDFLVPQELMEAV